MSTTGGRFPASGWPMVSIIFLAYNRREELQTSLQKVGQELDYPGALELMVVDNASTDGTADMLREEFPEVTLIRNPVNVGASAWNRGFAVASGAFILILDDDCYMEGDSLTRAVAQAQEQDAHIVSFRITTPYDPGFDFQDQYETGLLTFWGCAALFERRALQSVGGYDPNIFIWANELDLTMRMIDRGFRHLTLPEVEAVHMKKPHYQRFELRPYRINHRHFGYIAAKLLRPRDAAVVMVNLALRVLVQARLWDPRTPLVLPDLLRGCWAGLKVRHPVRPEVSSTYRTRFHQFAWPWPLFRSVGERLRGLGDPSAAARDRIRRREHFFAQGYYPSSASLLEI